MRLRELLFLATCIAIPANAGAATPRECDKLFARVLGPTEEEWNKLLENEGDFFVLAKRNPKETFEWNESVLRALQKEAIPLGPGTERRSGLKRAEIAQLFQDVSARPEVQASLCGRYRSSALMGFCWGRAMAAHLTALQEKYSLHKNAVRKLWAVGDLRSGENSWRYHVTTIVRAEDGSWHALDPNLPGPLPAEEWYDQMKENYDATRTMRIFSTPASRMGPGSWYRYSKAEFTRQEYKDFFADIMRAVHRENTGRESWWDTLPRTPE